MRLTRIEIEGFGSLQGMDLRFGPAMNLVVGPNEAGKSTLQEAIVTGLYGLRSGNGARAAIIERADRRRPWQGGNFGLALEFALDDGTQLRVERDLDAETTRVTDVGTGADLTDRFERDASGAIQLGRQLLGVSRDIYTNTACISRSEVMRLEDAGIIKEVIVALADSAHPDRTAQRVLDRLRQERVHRIGKPRGRSGPLHDLESRLAELERQLGAARQARASVDDLAQKRETVGALTEAELGIVQTLEAGLLARWGSWRRSGRSSMRRRRATKRAPGASMRRPSPMSRPCASCCPRSMSGTRRRPRATSEPKRPPKSPVASPSGIPA